MLAVALVSEDRVRDLLRLTSGGRSAVGTEGEAKVRCEDSTKKMDLDHPLHRTRLKWTLLRGRFWESTEVVVEDEIVRSDSVLGVLWRHVVLFARDNVAEGQQRIMMTVIEPFEVSESKDRPAVVVLHGTFGDRRREEHRGVELARLGFIAVVADLRYHGDRRECKDGLKEYYEALVRAYDHNGSVDRTDLTTGTGMSLTKHPSKKPERSRTLHLILFSFHPS